MPELPEVETIVRDLRNHLQGQSIKDVAIRDARVIRPGRAQTFKRQVCGHAVVNLTRRGKALVVHLNDGGFLVVQLMMTGQLIFSSQKDVKSATKVTFRLSNGKYLIYNDQRLFGRLQYVRDLKTIKYFRIIGPEPLSEDFNVPWLRDHLQRRKVPIKTLLMDHTFLAGIGNIYASEILFDCGIDPRRSACSLRKGEARDLHRSTVDVLEEAIRFRGTSMHTYRDGSGQKDGFLNRIKVYGRENEPCPQCHRPLKKIVLSGRSTFYCPRCQR